MRTVALKLSNGLTVSLLRCRRVGEDVSGSYDVWCSRAGDEKICGIEGSTPVVRFYDRAEPYCIAGQLAL